MSTVRLADFDITERLCFSAGWRPPQPSQPEPKVWRWVGWREFLQDWAAVRSEFIAARGDRRPNGGPFFADVATEYARQHGLAALEASRAYSIHGEPETFEGETPQHYRRRCAGFDDDPDPPS